MYQVENLTNGSLMTSPEWVQTPEQAMQAAAVTVSVARGNIKLTGTPKHFTLTDSRGTTQAYRVLDTQRARLNDLVAHVARRSR